MMVRMGVVLSGERCATSSSVEETEVWEVDSWLNYPASEATVPLNQGQDHMEEARKSTSSVETNEENLKWETSQDLEAQGSKTPSENEEMQVSATERASNTKTGELLGETIWKTTLTYLQEASGLLHSPDQPPAPPTTQPFIPAFPGLEGPRSQPDSLLSLIATLNNYLAPHVKKLPSRQLHQRTALKANLQTRLIEECKSSFLYSFLAKKGKKGRKPHPITCFMCSVVVPYKRDFIHHLRDVHGIERSQSLMYKRINQGTEEIKKRYCGPKQVFKITVSR